MVATQEQVSRFQTASSALVALAIDELRDVWAALDLEGNPIRIRDLLLELFPDLVVSFSDVAAVLAADFYDELRNVRVSASPFRAVIAPAPPVEQSQAAVRFGLSAIFQSAPDPASAFETLSGSLQRLVMQGGRSTLIGSASRDPYRSGFARMPIGDTCPWCISLASRGFVYATAESAGQFDRWHDNCNCVVIPGTSRADLPENYDLDEYRRLYASGEGIGDSYTPSGAAA